MRSENATTPITLVTGGSDGIGRAIAMRFAKRGQDVLLVARDAGRLVEAAEAIQKATGRAVTTLLLDLVADDAMERLVGHLTQRGAHVEVLVNSAGIGLSGGFTDHSPAEIDRLIALNITALTRLMRFVLPGMQARGRGHILNIASLGGYAPGPYQAAYYASKAYVISLGEAVAAELVRDGVRVTTLAPGPVNTRFHARMGAESALYRRLMPAMSPEAVARWAELAMQLRLRTVAPGIINSILQLALRILPHRVGIPIVALLLKPRSREARNA